MVGAWLEGVLGAASRLGGVVVEISARDDSDLGHPFKGSRWLSSVASLAHSAFESTAASGSVLCAEFDILLGGHTAAILESFGGAECPARATRGLVTDLGDNLAFRPLCARVESVWDVVSKFREHRKHRGWLDHSKHTLLTSIMTKQNSKEHAV